MMGVHNFKDLKKHVGHKIVCVAYGHDGETQNVAIECKTCMSVLMDFDKEV